jgi:aspartate 1-decarboxylase
MLRGKIHRAKITSVNMDYEGSITIDQQLMEAADILPYEMVHVLDINNGARFQTYAIEGEPGSGIIVINGAAARLVAQGDIVIILAYGSFTENEARQIQPNLVYVDAQNSIVYQKADSRENLAILPG